MEAKAAARKAATTQFRSRDDCGGDDNAGTNNIDELSESEDEGDPMLSDRASKARESAITIRKVVLTSIMLQTTNQYCNALQSVMGIFLHSCNTPEDIIEVLARIGVSISTTSINDAVTSLSKESSTSLRRLGKTLTTSFA
ncbi:hypothetical protein CCMSSC00406_0007701 [Pleurotus cornucopiae]|uniref:Uncharacterized protein n=1 Tax=Pleurotus cornucopiae TaxID=5321 RepID=A0ACB7J1Z1_PLECO|nr:hypothetical protein CCMSSC00406_0007701 [Pleurotus cornucopiae]